MLNLKFDAANICLQSKHEKYQIGFTKNLINDFGCAFVFAKILQTPRLYCGGVFFPVENFVVFMKLHFMLNGKSKHNYKLIDIMKVQLHQVDGILAFVYQDNNKSAQDQFDMFRKLMIFVIQLIKKNVEYDFFFQAIDF